MALRQLMIGQKLTALRAEKTQLEEAAGKLAERRAAWSEREKQAEEAFGELTDETTAEERAAFEAEAAEIEKLDAQIRADEEANQTRAGEVDAEIKKLEDELEEINKRGAAKPAAPTNKQTEGGFENMDRSIMTNDERARRRAELREMCKNDEVQNFLGIVREKRAVSGATYTIPTIMLPLVVEAISRSSKLLKHVNVTELNGDGLINVLAAAPEAVWTATVGKINEVTLTVNQIQTTGSKLGSFVPVPNPYLEDSAEDLAGIVIDQLGQGHGYALDKAILYGTGTNMPVGIVTRLAATTAPAWWQASMPAFVNLSATHIGRLSAATVKGADLYKELVGILGQAEQKHAASAGDLFWAMNQATYTKLKQELVSINASGAVVTGAAPTMPVIGGAVEILDFIPANNIVGGWGQEYKLIRRRGIQIAASEHAQFIDDNTLYKATSRWDGIPIAGEGFAAFSLTTTAVTTSIQFAQDTANTPNQ